MSHPASSRGLRENTERRVSAQPEDTRIPKPSYYRPLKPDLEACRLSAGPAGGYTAEGLEEVARWCGGEPFTDGYTEAGNHYPAGVTVPTLEGPKHAHVGEDVIYRNPKTNRFGVMSLSAFEATYEPKGRR